MIAGLLAWVAAPSAGLGTARAASAAGTTEALPALPAIAELEAALGGRSPHMGRLSLEVPRLADNGNAVPMRVIMPGPFERGAHVESIALYSSKNPVPVMAMFSFPAPLAHVEVESRVRLAGSQHVVALATLANGERHAAFVDVAVMISGCLDGT